MAVNRSEVRRDLPYLRRRVKPQAPDAAAAVSGPGAVAPAAPARGVGLDLGRSGASVAPAGAPASPATARGVGLDLGTRGGSAEAATAPAARAGGAAASVRPRLDAGPQPFPAPTVSSVRELDDDEPVLRLDARQSAVGSLIVSGATHIAWESTDLVTGAAAVPPSGAAASGTGPTFQLGVGDDVSGTPVFTTGNRALVGFDGGDAIVSLRHLAQLRRALFIGGDGPLSVQLFDGSGFTVATGDGSRLFILALLRVGNLIELRAEPVARSLAPADIHLEFGFELTHRLATREPRRR